MTTEIAENLRCSERIGVRTPVVIYESTMDGTFSRSRGWTDDLSIGGVKLVTESRLAEETLYVRIMLPELKDKVFVCALVREDHSSLKSLQTRFLDVRRWSYGARFIGLAAENVLVAIEEVDVAALSLKAAKVKNPGCG